MATNLALDDKLIILAQKLGNHSTKKSAVTSALKEYIAHRNQQKIASSFGRVDFDRRYDYKRARNK